MDMYHVKSREERALSQRIFTINRENEQFTVCGTNGDLYNVRFCDNGKWHCTCPDFVRNCTGIYPCKHIIHVTRRVLRIPREDPLWCLASLGPEDEVRLRKWMDENMLAITTTIQAAQASAASFGNNIPGSNSFILTSQLLEHLRRISKDDTECIVCYDEIDQKSERSKASLFICHQCGHNIHGQCWEMWRAHQESGRATCPFCRASNTHRRA